MNEINNIANTQIVENNKQKKEVVEILLDDIVPNRFQPRLTFDMEALNELAASIKEHGIIQPLIVRKLQDKYEIIAGERRFKAASLAGLQKVPCIIMNLDDNESAEVAVIENIQRKEMTPLEEAKSFKKILDKGYITQDELAKKLGKNQSTIANKLRLLNLDETVQDAILNEKISERHARSLLKITDKNEQRNMLKEILEKRLTVRQLDDLIKDKFEKSDEVVMNNNNINNSNTVLVNDIFKNTNSNEMIQSQNSNINSLQNDSLNIFKFNNPPQKQETELNQVLNPNVLSTSSTNILNNTTDAVNNVMSPNVLSTPVITEEKNTNMTSLNNLKENTTTIQTLNTSPVSPTVNDILNPSVLSTPVITEEKNTNMINLNDIKTTESLNSLSNGMSVDVNDIRNNTSDINVEKPQANMNILMSNDGTDKPVNRFVMDINAEPQLELNNVNVEKTKKVINDAINNLKLDGIYLEFNEKNTDNIYEITLRLNK